MRPIRLAVVFDQQILAGGGYQQALNAAILTKSISKEIAEPIFFTTLRGNIPVLESYGIKAKYLPISLVDKIMMSVRRQIWNPYLLKWIKIISPLNAFEKILFNNEIDLVYFLTPDAGIGGQRFVIEAIARYCQRPPRYLLILSCHEAI
jgi:hypothetical protein